MNRADKIREHMNGARLDQGTGMMPIPTEVLDAILDELNSEETDRLLELLWRRVRMHFPKAIRWILDRLLTGKSGDEK